MLSPATGLGAGQAGWSRYLPIFWEFALALRNVCLVGWHSGSVSSCSSACLIFRGVKTHLCRLVYLGLLPPTVMAMTNAMEMRNTWPL